MEPPDIAGNPTGPGLRLGETGQMSASPFEIPELVRQRAMHNGSAGRRWLDDLPRTAAELATRWGLTFGRTYRGGTAGCVVDATDADGRACVLKIAMPLDMDERETFIRSVRAHELAAGRGCAAIFAHDEEAPAMLLERLGSNLDELGMPVADILEAIASTLCSFWRPIGIESGLRTGADQARWLARYIDDTWHALGEPCERPVIDRALEYCDRRIEQFDPRTTVLVHGDAHGWNTLDAGNGTFKFVDVEGLCSHPEHDLSVAMREYNEPLLDGDTARLVHDRAETLAERCSVDATAVNEWGYIERVSTGLANIRDFDNDNGAAFLEVARRCL